jgi:hypothetical protein
MAALAYRDDKILARNLLSRPFFCLTPAEPFFRPDRSSTAPSCRVAVKDGRAFSRPPEGLVLDGREHDGTLAVSERKTTMRGSGAGLVTTTIVAVPVPVPAVSTECGNSNREVHQLSRFSDHQTACSCS